MIAISDNNLADDGRLPAGVVAAGVGLVQLVAEVLVVADEEEGDAEGAQAAVLRVGLLVVAHGRHRLLQRHAPPVLVLVPRAPEPRLVDEGGGVGGHARDGAVDVGRDLVRLLGGASLHEQLGGHLALGREHDAVRAAQADARAGVGDGLDGVLDLVQAALGGEGGGG